MKKRILSILRTLCMMLCLTPISVFAEEVGAWGSAAIKLGADALNKSRVNISVYEKINKGGLISSYRNNITLKKGHIYNVWLSGSLEVGSNESNKSGNYSIQMTDGYDDDLCRELTRIKRDGAKIPQTNDQHSFNFNRMYDASNKAITLQLWFENSAYNTYLGGFRGTITITALNWVYITEVAKNEKTNT